MSRRRRILLVTLGTLVALALLAPLLARTGAARRFVASRLSDALGRPVEIEGIDAGWTSGVTVRGLKVRGAAAEFRGTPLVEAASVTLEDPLPSLVLSGASRVAIKGLKVRVEEQAGGRTNVDDLVKSLAKPRPPAPKREARPFRLTLTDASIRVQRLLPRPQPRRIDPFREDPVVLDADFGLVVVGVERMDLRLDATPGETTLDLTAALDVKGRPGRAEIALRLGPGGPSGLVHLEGIDLSLLDPFVKGLKGRVELRAEGSPAGADVKLRAEGLNAGRIDEAWAELTGRIRKDGDGVAFDALSLRTASGAFSLDGRGAWPPRGIEIRAQASPEPLGIDLKGPLRLDVRGEGPDLNGTLTAPDLDARFDVAVRDGAVEIRNLDAKGFDSSVTLKGEVGKVLRLSGRADVDLKDLRPLLPDGASLEGRLRVPAFELLDRSLKADADVAALRARGFFAEDVEIDHGEVHVDAALSEDGNVLRIARAQLDGLAAQGTISGLDHGKLAADGTVQGTLALNPLHARLLGLHEVRGLRGQMTVDARAATGEQGIEASGIAAIDRFHVETDRGPWDLGRVSAEGSCRGGDATVRVSGDGLELKGSLAGGKGALEIDIEAIERQPLLVRLLPEDLTLEGPLKLRSDVESAPWRIAGTLESTAFTAEVGGRGVLGESLRLSFTAREAEPGWFVTMPELVLENLGMRASLGEGLLGRDGSLGGRVLIEAPLDRLSTVAPETARLGPVGGFAVDVLAAYDGRWSFTGNVAASDASLLLSGKRTPTRTARLEFDASLPGDGTATLRRMHLTAKATDLEGSASFGGALTVRMHGKTRLEEIAPYAPMFRGSGEVVFDGIALDLDAEGRLSASASLASESIRVQGGRLQKAKVRSRAEGRLSAGALSEVRTTLSVTAARAERGNILVEDLLLLEKGEGRSGEYTLGTHVQGGRVQVGATSWEQVRLDVRGRLDRLLGERPPAGITGDIRFARWYLGPFLWEDAKGRIAIEEGNVVVRDLVAGLHGGTVKAQGTLTPAGERLAWEASAQATGLVLTERIGRPLSFVIPFLRVKKEAGQLKGRADLDLKLSAEDTTDAAILRTLAGGGQAHLYDIEATNSILLPLLSFRLDKAILREPFRFKDLVVSFDVGDGSIRPAPFELEAKPFGIDVKEIEVGLDGTVNALVVPGILPLRVRGTLDDPDVRPAPLAPFR